ncbi:MAG: hypothetical protein ABT01_00370 [Clostridium sp. SCN 57-10]|nr:MAG: hypothetical protein ABT01_00370 [Clostridium sp. SCN 57-10]
MIETLITDRTQGDVEQRTAKGYYNASDLNRVGQAMRYVAARIAGMGGACAVNPKTDWAMHDIPTETQMAAYLSDLATIRAAYAALPNTPAVPVGMDRMGYSEANDIEQILVDIDWLLTNATAAWYYSGTDLYSGEAGQ